MADLGDRRLDEVRVRATDVQRFVERSRCYVGCGAPDVPAGIDVASWLNVSRFVEATGDENPLYTDVQYGAGSMHHTMLAPPTFVLAVRSPVSVAALDVVPEHRLVDRVAALQLVWADTTRLADRITGEVTVTDVTTRYDAGGSAYASVHTAADYARDGAPLARGHCEVEVRPVDDVAASLTGRTIHRYRPDEIARIVDLLENEPTARGNEPRFWSRTTDGERLPALLKGPLTFSDLFVWVVAEARPVKAGNLHHRDLVRLPGRRATNPLTGWPAWDRRDGWLDSATSDVVGLPAPAAPPGLVFALAGQYLTGWMGDAGFLQRLRVRFENPLLYGDLLTLEGVVVDHFRLEDEEARCSFAVSVRTVGRNQLGDVVLESDAVVLLPEPGRPVPLPVRGVPRIGGA